MTRLALVKIETGEVLSTHEEGRGSVKLPGVGEVSPPVAGWEGGGELITTEGPPRFRLLELVPVDQPPKGQQEVAGSRRLVLDGDVVREIADYEDIPEPPPEPTREEKIGRLLADYGLTLDDLKEAATTDAAAAKTR
jgi:hypothetical protein